MAEEIKTPELEAIEKVAGQVEAFKKTLGNKADKEDFESITKTINELKAAIGEGDESVPTIAKKLNKEFGDFSTKMEEIRESINLLKDGGKGASQNKSFGQQFVEALKLKNITKDSLRKGQHEIFEVNGLINKAAATMTTANVTPVGTSSIPFSLSEAEPGLTRIQRRMPWIMQIANTSPTSKPYVQYAEQKNADGAANETAEGLAKNLIDFDWVEKSQKVEKITAYIKVSKESLDDLDGLQAEIDNELVTTILLKADLDLLTGDGTTPSIAGILTMDTAWAAGALALAVEQANRADVIRAAINQIVSANFMPNYALLHPSDVALMDLTKASDGHYSLPPFRSADGMMISGVRILENTGQTADSFTVGDFTKLNVRIREGVTIDMGLDADDFTKNLVTILGEIRLASYIKSNHAGAFVSGTFVAAMAALETA